MRTLLVTASFLVFAARAQALTLLLAAGSGTSFDPALPHLKYAAADAEQFTGAMKSVGLTSADQTNLRTDPTREELLAAFDEAGAAFKNETGSGARKFIFYYSGHADERGLHLKDGLLTTAELHRRLDRIPARTKVIILDSCYAAALASKGVKPVEGMLGPRIGLDEPTGTIFLTASSARDVALESSALRGSLFTGQLIAGLYGDADGNRDGVVTATELYEYAFRKTQLASYMLPVGAPQKPEMVEDLKGRGAVALSFPAGKMGRLLLPETLAGRVSVQAVAGVTSLELQKIASTRTDLALPAGAYQLWVKDGPRVGQASFAIATDKETQLAADAIAWHEAASQSTAAMVKGPAGVIAMQSPGVAATAAAPAPHPLRAAALVGAALYPSVGVSGNGFDAELTVARSDDKGSLEGLGLIAAGRRIAMPGGMRELRSAAYLAYLWNAVPTSSFGVGLRLDAGLGASNDQFSGAATQASAVGRLGLAFTIKQGFWLGFTHEAQVKSAGRYWDTAGVGWVL